MTIAELIEELKKLDPSLLVVTTDCEGEYTEAKSLSIVRFWAGPPEDRQLLSAVYLKQV